MTARDPARRASGPAGPFLDPVLCLAPLLFLDL